MFLATPKGLSVLSSNIANKTTNKLGTELIQDDNGKYHNIISSSEQNEIYDKLNLNNVHIKAKELFAISSVFNYKDKEYHTVLQKIGNSFKPVKVFEKVDGKLNEVEPFDFANGKDGVYYSIDDLNKFLSSIVFKFNDETNDYNINFSQEIKDFIGKNIRKDENNKPTLMVNVDNVATWTKLIQENINITDFDKFKKDTRTKVSRLYSYLNDTKLDAISNTFCGLLEKGEFNKIDADAVTKITFSDIPTLQRISSGQIDNKNIEFAARNKMFDKFLSRNDFEMKKCEAANYLIAGFSNSTIPVFYSSAIFNDKAPDVKFGDILDKATKEIKDLAKSGKLTKQGLLEVVNKNENEKEIYKYAYLSILKDALFAKTSDFDSYFDMVEVMLKNSSHDMDSKILSSLLKSKKNERIDNNLLKTIYLNAIDSSMLLSRANYLSGLEVKPVESGAIIYNSQQGQKLPIEIFYNNHEQIANFAKNVGIRKDGDSVDTYYGTSLVGITEVENSNGKLTPIATHRFFYSSTNYEQLGNIISNLSKVNSEGKIVYENLNDNMEMKESVYDFDIDKNIKNLEKIIYGDKFYNPNTKEPYKSVKHIAELLNTAFKKIQNIDRITSDLPSKVKAIKEVINEETILQKLKEVGEAKKPDFDAIQRMTIASMNQSFLNRFILKNKDDLLAKSPYIKNPRYPKFITDRDEALSIANKTTNATILDLERNLRTFSYLQENHLNNPKEEIERIRAITNGASKKYDGVITKEKMTEIKERKELSMETLLKSITSVIAAKYTQNVPLNINKLHLDAFKAEFFPLSKDDEYKTKYTNSKELLKLIEKKTDATFEAIHEIKEDISNKYKSRIETNQANKKASYSYEFENEVSSPANNEDKKHKVEKFKLNLANFENESLGFEYFDTKKEATEFIKTFSNDEKGLSAKVVTSTQTVEKNKEMEVETVNINENTLAEAPQSETIETANIEEQKIDEVALEEIKFEESYDTPFDEPVIEAKEIDINIDESMQIQNLEEEEPNTDNHEEEDKNVFNDEIFDLNLDEFDNLSDIDIPDLDAIDTEQDIVMDNYGMHR